MLSWGLILLGVLVPWTSAFPNGATLPPQFMMEVESLCTTGDMRPRHLLKPSQLHAMPRLDRAPYTLNVENPPGFKYRPGSTIRVTLQARPGHNFKGFFITADAQDATMGTKGTYGPARGNQAKATTYCAKGITHTGNATKSKVTILWKAHQNFTHGRMQFKATVVKNFETFYTDIKSRAVLAEPSAPTEKQFTQRQMKNVMDGMGRVPGMGGGIGGLLSNVNIGEMMKKMMGNMPGMGGNNRGPQNRGPQNRGPGNQGGPSMGMFGGGMPNIFGNTG